MSRLTRNAARNASSILPQVRDEFSAFNNTYKQYVGTKSQISKPVENKEKKIVNLGLLGKKRKNKQLPSQKESLLTTLIKKKAVRDEDIIKNAAEKGISPGTKEERDYFAQLVSMSLGNTIKKKSLMPNLMSTPLKIYSLMKIANSFVTSDILYWLSISYANFSSYFSIGTMKSVYVISQGPIIYEDPKKLDCFYAEDNDTRFYTNITDPQVALTLTDPVPYDISGDSYQLYGTPDKQKQVYTLTIPGNLDQQRETIRNKIANTIFIKTKSDLVSGIKIIDQESGAAYFQSNIKVTDFSPPTLNFRNNVDFYCLSKYELDPNLLLNNIDLSVNDVRFVNLLDLENIHAFAELIGILCLKGGMSDELKNQLMKAYKYYVDNKPMFTLVKKMYSEFKNITLQYLDSFQNRIQLDRMEKLKEKVSNYLEEYDVFLNIPELDRFKSEFLEPFKKNCTNALNFMKSTQIKEAIELVKNALKVITDGNMKLTNIEEHVRAAALNLFKFMFNGTMPVLNNIRSTNSFLSSVTGNMTESGLGEKINTFLEDIKNKQLKMDDIKKKIELENVSDYQKGIVLGQASALLNDMISEIYDKVTELSDEEQNKLDSMMINLEAYKENLYQDPNKTMSEQNKIIEDNLAIYKDYAQKLIDKYKASYPELVKYDQTALDENTKKRVMVLKKIKKKKNPTSTEATVSLSQTEEEKEGTI